jgi:nucleolar GTP-binding protein
LGNCDSTCLILPGILDHLFGERNTFEMQAVTTLVHLVRGVLYVVHISGQCGYAIEQQCLLINSIKSLFANNELKVVVNEVDHQAWETLNNIRRRWFKPLQMMPIVHLWTCRICV